MIYDLAQPHDAKGRRIDMRSRMRDELRASKLLLDDVPILNQLPDGKRRHFAAFPIVIANAGGSWAPLLVWDTRDLDGDRPAAENPAALPLEISASRALVRSGAGNG